MSGAPLFQLRPMEFLRGSRAGGGSSTGRAWGGGGAGAAWAEAGGDAKLPSLPDGMVFMARPTKRMATRLDTPSPGHKRAESRPAFPEGCFRCGGGGMDESGGGGGDGGGGGGGGGGVEASGCASSCEQWGSTARDYCQRTTLHGLKYVGDEDLHLVERLFWGLIFSLAAVACAYYIYFLYDKWRENPVIMSLSPAPTRIEEIPFPAVTVCNMNRAKRSVAQPIVERAEFPSGGPGMVDDPTLDFSLLRNLCDVENSSSSEDDNQTNDWDIVRSFLVRVGQPCYEMIAVCIYGGKTRKCMELFNPSLTDEGICCSFNKVQREFLFRNPRDLSDLNVTFTLPQADWTPESGYPADEREGVSPLRPHGTGSHLGLTLLLDAQVDEYYCSSTTSVGFKVVLHSPVETPKIAYHGLVASPGQELRLVVQPRAQNATPELRHIPVDKRQCFFSGEKPLKFYRTYTQRNCALECEANHTLQSCHCVLYYMPKDAETRICGSKEEECATKARNEMETIGVTTDDNSTASRCMCLPGCSEISYRNYISTSYLAPDFSLSKEYTRKFNNSYFKKNMAIIHIFFTQSQFTSHLKAELFGFTEFLSSTGGLLGLFLGFSFMSLVEVIYYLTLRLWCTVSKSRKQLQDSSTTIAIPHTFAIYPFTQ